MKKNFNHIFWMTANVTVVLCMIMQCAYAGEDAKSILLKVEKKYERIHDVRVSFTQHVRFGVTQSEQTFAGTMLMKKGNNYHIELEDQTIITDGKSVWSYTKSNKQVIIDKYKEDPGSFSPDKILVNVPEHYTPSLFGKETVNGNESSILKLIPIDTKSNLQWMKVWVDHDEWLMRKIQVLDISDNLTTYAIDSLRINEGVTQAQFIFKTPDGVEVIDLR
jgi:chaperone LolA